MFILNPFGFNLNLMEKQKNVANTRTHRLSVKQTDQWMDRQYINVPCNKPVHQLFLIVMSLLLLLFYIFVFIYI